MGSSHLDELQPLGIGARLGALHVLMHEAAEILDSGILWYGLRLLLVQLCDVGRDRDLPLPVDGLKCMGIGGGIVHEAVIGKYAEE